MSFRLRSLVLALAAAAALPSALAGGPTETSAAASPPTDRLIVRYRDGRTTGLDTIQAAANQRGVQFRMLRRNAFGALVLRLDRRLAADDADQLASALAAADPDIEYAEADRLMQPMFTPNDANYSVQWHYFEATGGLNLPSAWDKATGAGVRVAVIDTGYRPHADLAANLVGGYDFIGDTFVGNDGSGRDADASDPGDAVTAGECGNNNPAQGSSWHGTHVAGTIAAVTNNGVGVAGVAFGAKVVPVRALGKCGGYTSDIADAIVWSAGGTVSGVPANANPARVLNLSLGGGGACDTTTQNAVNTARSLGAVVVVAAGNSNANAGNFSPASCTGVVTVAATNRSGGRAYYSNFGTVVDVAAPGGDVRSSSTNGILSTLNSGTNAPAGDVYAWYQGTSMAAPHVAGVVALMLQANPALTPDEVESRLKSTSRAFPATCSQCGSGIVDANAAVIAATGGGGGTTPTPVAEVENNNTRNSAQSVTANPALVSGRIASTTDTDYYRVTLGAGKTLTSTLTPPSSADYDLYIYNANGTQVASSTNGTGAVDSVAVSNTGTASATVFVRVRYYSGGSGNYTLLLSQ